MEIATLGAGCFWCVEAIFQSITGVLSVEPGYAGGKTNNPTYEEICTGDTGHAEVCRIKYDSDIIAYSELLDVFWATHDPTTLNKQGADEGTQYRSVIFYHNEEQKKVAKISKENASNKLGLNNPIVTEISPILNYYTAEKYHHNYYKNNPNAPYCKLVISPKIEKFNNSKN